MGLKSEVTVQQTTFKIELTERDNVSIEIAHANGTFDKFVLGKEETSKFIDALRFVRYN